MQHPWRGSTYESSHSTASRNGQLVTELIKLQRTELRGSFNMENLKIFQVEMVGQFKSFTPSFFQITPLLLHFLLDIWNFWISDLKIQSWIFLNKRTLSYQLQSISYFYFF